MNNICNSQKAHLRSVSLVQKRCRTRIKQLKNRFYNTTDCQTVGGDRSTCISNRSKHNLYRGLVDRQSQPTSPASDTVRRHWTQTNIAHARSRHTSTRSLLVASNSKLLLTGDQFDRVTRQCVTTTLTSRRLCSGGASFALDNSESLPTYSYTVDVPVASGRCPYSSAAAPVASRCPVMHHLRAAASPDQGATAVSDKRLEEEESRRHSDVGSAALPMSAIPGPTPLPYVGTMYKYIPFVGEYNLTL